jgi:hypothetical protein
MENKALSRELYQEQHPRNPRTPRSPAELAASEARLKSKNVIKMRIRSGKLERGLCFMCQAENACAVFRNPYDPDSFVWACLKHKKLVARDSLQSLTAKKKAVYKRKRPKKI